MTIIDAELLLTEISAEDPAGEDLEYDPDFAELDRLSAKKPERAIDNPGSEAEVTDWKAIKKGSLQLLTRTKDLRVAILLTRALINTDGFPGLAEGMALIQELLTRYWDSLHPQLDAEDDNDPTMRMNCLVTLCDREAVINPISKAALVTVKGWGSYNLVDIHNSTVVPAEGEENKGASADAIKAAFLECPIEDLKETGAALVSAQANLMAIDDLIMKMVGSSSAPDLGGLAKILKELTVTVGSYLELRGEVSQTVDSDSGSAPSANKPAQEISGEITSRESATKMMDKISEYFRKHEPSSPVPLLMQRAKRVSNMGFMEIVRDMAPDGLHQAQNIGGTESE